MPNAASDLEAVTGADVVLSLTTAAFALAAAQSVAGELAPGALYADLNTSAPQLKRELADALPVPFADVALIGAVPNLGLKIPALASGAGAERFAELFRPLGMPVEVVGEQPGDAAGMKLLRSVFMKGLAAIAIESLEAAKAAGVEDRVRADITGVIGEPLLERLLTGTQRARRAACRGDASDRGLRRGAGRGAAHGHGGRRVAGADPRRAVSVARRPLARSRGLARPFSGS